MQATGGCDTNTKNREGLTMNTSIEDFYISRFRSFELLVELAFMNCKTELDKFTMTQRLLNEADEEPITAEIIFDTFKKENFIK
jgi:hypothetical protein